MIELRIFVNELKTFEVLYNQKFTSDQVKIWHHYLKSWDLKKFQETKDRVVKEVPRFPTISDFYKNQATMSNYQGPPEYKNQTEEEREVIGNLIKETIKNLEEKAKNNKKSVPSGTSTERT